MYNIQEIAKSIFFVGGSDRRLERFENMLPLPNGVSYNSYLIVDEKTALIDTVDSSISGLHLANVEEALGGRELDFLVVNHMEPDHGANLEEILRRYPGARIVGNSKTFQFFSQFFNMDISYRCISVKECDALSLGGHTLRFYMAPMVHWPEVMCTYEVSSGILFSADAFGTFGALSGSLFADEVDFEHTFLDEARRYYANIVGRYGAQVQALFKKLSGLGIQMICPLHGPIWRENLSYLLEKYNLWSTYTPEKKGVLILYASMYGHTENAVNVLAGRLAEKGSVDLHMYDVSKTHASYIIAEAWRYSHLVFASPTYNMHLYFPMDALLLEMAVLGLKNRKIAVIGCHSWASAAVKIIQERLETMKNMELLCPPIDIRSSVKPPDEAALSAMAEIIYASLKE